MDKRHEDFLNQLEWIDDNHIKGMHKPRNTSNDVMVMFSKIMVYRGLSFKINLYKGCGMGRHALYLQEQGFDVTGTDNSPLVVKICKLRGMKNVKLMAAEEISAFKTNSFDSVIMLGNNFGLFESSKKAKKMLKSLYRITSPSARIITDSVDPHKTNKQVHLQYHRENLKKGKMAGQLLLRIRFEKHIGQWIQYLFVSKKEMVDILDGTGWGVTKFIDGTENRYAAIIEKIKK